MGPKKQTKSKSAKASDTSDKKPKGNNGKKKHLM